MIYLDSSAILKLVLSESESDAFKAYLADHDRVPRATSAVSMVEVPRAVARSEPLGMVTVYQTLDEMTRIRVDGSVMMSAASLTPATLRSLDAIHLASALALQPHLTAFVSYDRKLLDAATFHDLPVASPS